MQTSTQFVVLALNISDNVLYSLPAPFDFGTRSSAENVVSAMSFDSTLVITSFYVPEIDAATFLFLKAI